MNKENLQRLASYLYHALVLKGVRFDMDVFCEIKNWDTEGQEQMTECGSIGCAIGFGTYAGIKKLLGEDFLVYAERVFLLSFQSKRFDWCFSNIWTDIDDTQKGAAQRIQYLIDGGSDFFYIHPGSIRVYENTIVPKPKLLDRIRYWIAYQESKWL